MVFICGFSASKLGRYAAPDAGASRVFRSRGGRGEQARARKIECAYLAHYSLLTVNNLAQRSCFVQQLPETCNVNSLSIGYCRIVCDGQRSFALPNGVNSKLLRAERQRIG